MNRRTYTPEMAVDLRVPITQSTELFPAFVVDTEMVSYPRQGHGFHERAFQLDLLQRLVGWFDRYLRGDADSGTRGEADAKD